LLQKLLVRKQLLIREEKRKGTSISLYNPVAYVIECQ